MQIFIDSNQFISDFLLKGAPFRYLLHFLSNSGNTLLLSRLVIEEVENKYGVEAQKALADATKSRQRLKQLGLAQGAVVDDLPTEPAFDLEQRIREHVEGIEIVEYAAVPHADVVQRALKRRKPFDAEGDVGYRDSLLWLSLVHHMTSVARNEDEEIIFISSNWRDFYEAGPGKQSKSMKDGKSKPDAQPQKPGSVGAATGGVLSAPGTKVDVQFHPDLMHDLTNLKRPVHPFDSVASFVDTKVDKNEHVINYEKKFELFEEFLEENGLNVLRRLEERNGLLVLQQVFSLPLASALTILGSDAETFEGVEDLDIYIAEEVGHDIYVSCGYDLRIVNVTLFVPRVQFDAYRHEIEAAPHVWEATPLDETVAIRLSLRAYYQASLSFDPSTKTCEGFSLHTFDVR